MLSWFDDDDDGPVPGPATWARLQDLFDEESDGYLRFRRSLLRDAAYEGLPYKLRRRLHGAVAARIAQEVDDPEEVCRHPFAALSCRREITGRPGGTPRSPGSAPTGSTRMSKPPDSTRARWKPGAASTTWASRSSLPCTGTWGMRGTSAAEFKKAADAYTAARRLVAGDPLMDAGLLLKRSHVEKKLGRFAQGAALGNAGARHSPRTGGAGSGPADGARGRLVRDGAGAEGRIDRRAPTGPSEL